MLILLGWFHFTMHFTNRAFRKLFQNMLVPFFKILQINLFALFNQRIDNINLASFVDLLTHRTIHAFPAIVELMDGSNRFSSGRKFIDNRHVQVTVQSHRQRTGNGSGSHYKHMRRLNILTPKTGTLSHAKTMLFVNHNEA